MTDIAFKSHKDVKDTFDRMMDDVVKSSKNKNNLQSVVLHTKLGDVELNSLHSNSVRIPHCAMRKNCYHIDEKRCCRETFMGYCDEHFPRVIAYDNMHEFMLAMDKLITIVSEFEKSEYTINSERRRHQGNVRMEISSKNRKEYAKAIVLIFECLALNWCFIYAKKGMIYNGFPVNDYLNYSCNTLPRYVDILGDEFKNRYRFISDFNEKMPTTLFPLVV